MIVTPQIEIPDGELHLEFVHVPPGGQNVNKVATAVQLRFDVAHSPSLPDDVRERLLRIGGRRVTDDGVLVIDARRARTQSENRNLALAQFVALVRRPLYRRASVARRRQLRRPRSGGCRKSAQRGQTQPSFSALTETYDVAPAFVMPQAAATLHISCTNGLTVATAKNTPDQTNPLTNSVGALLHLFRICNGFRGMPRRAPAYCCGCTEVRRRHKMVDAL